MFVPAVQTIPLAIPPASTRISVPVAKIAIGGPYVHSFHLPRPAMAISALISAVEGPAR